ncbi:MAG: pteridine reductase [Steroidobacteraceae bacterium]|jgi:pteridine reductase|nr:pteridine reductase [Steroidobacteraceae bacterium]
MTTSLPLHGRAVLITGGARRLGAAIARQLHAEGANVLLHYRGSAAEAEALAARLNATRAGSCALHAADLLDVARLPGLVEAALEAFGRLDVLVNNASTFYPTPVGSITLEQWDDLTGSNLRAPLFLSQAAAPELQRRHGLILNLVDIHALRPLKRHPVYCAAKAGLWMLTQSLARELAPEVRVNGIAPGPVMWPEGPMDAELQAKILERTALKRIGSPEDIAKAALFFVRDAPYVTGQVLPVDGGRTVGGF